MNDGGEVRIPENLRSRAEKIVERDTPQIDVSSSKELQKLIHELRVHQVELELQNEELRSTQRDLENARNRYRRLYNDAPFGYVAVGENALIGTANETFGKMVGVDPYDLNGVPFANFVVSADRPVFHGRFNAFRKNPKGKAIEVRMTGAQGESFHAHIEGKIAVSQTLSDRLDQADGALLLIVHNVERRAQAELSDARRKKQLDAVLQSVPDSIMLLSSDNRVVWANHGPESAVGKHCYTALHTRKTTCENCPVAAAVETGAAQGGTVTLDDETMLDLRAVPLNPSDESGSDVLVIERDITHKHRMEVKLNQAHKMEAIGRLAGGVAHDFNNLLTGIIGNISIAAEETDESEPLHAMLMELLEASERTARITSRLMTFSRESVHEREPVDIANLIRNNRAMLEKLIGEDVSLEVYFDDCDKYVQANAPEIEQVLLNLVINARDAMPDGGRVVIEACLNEEQGSAPAMVQIKVSDTGVGMTEGARLRAFEPFFTTKPAGKGSGLGLATAYSVVTQHDGTIELVPNGRRGTSCVVRLPSIPRPERQKDPGENMKSDAKKGDETILYVEDDAMVRKLNITILEKLGYRVLQAEDGAGALALVNSLEEELHMLITDVIMPEMNGEELSKRIRMIRPDIKVLFTSGYTEDIIAPRGVLQEDTHFLSKPYRPSQLAEKVRDILDS